MQKQNNPTTEIREETIQILKTILLLEKAYSQGYVQRIVLGDTRFPLRNINHKDLETFGILEGVFFSRINGIIEYLIQIKLLEVLNSQYGTLNLTDAGHQYLDDPQALIVPLKEIRQAWYEFELSQSLRKLRKDIAEQGACEPYMVFTNFTLRQIIKHLPETIVELSQFPGMEATEETTRILIIGEVNRIVEKKILDEKTGIYSRSFSPSHRKVKELYIAGMDPSEIAKRRKVKLSTVEEYMITLHEAGQLDMRPYIEEKVDSKILHKAGKYFKEAANSKLQDAHEVLGFDYDTLRKCRTYVAQVHEPSDLAYAS